MNIFKILSSNDGSINEPNVSSFLAYLLDPNENHGLNGAFLEYFLSPLLLAHKDVYKELLTQNKERVKDLSNRSAYKVNVQAEITVIHETGGGRTKSRDIDVLIEIFHNKSPFRPRFAFCIENKIKDGAISRGGNQLFEEISGLEAHYADQADAGKHGAEWKPALALVFLTPHQSSRAEAEFEECRSKLKQSPALTQTVSCHLHWDEHITQMLNRTLQEEAAGNIEPIYDYTKHTLKSFLTFIKSDFQSYKEEKAAMTERRDYGKSVPEYYADAYDMLKFDTDYKPSEVKAAVKQLIYDASGKEGHKPTIDATLTFSIVNDRNRRHYGVTDAHRHSINLFYYPDESNRKQLRKLDREHPPAGIFIYWRDKTADGELGQALLTDIYPLDRTATADAKP